MRNRAFEATTKVNQQQKTTPKNQAQHRTAPPHVASAARLHSHAAFSHLVERRRFSPATSTSADPPGFQNKRRKQCTMPFSVPTRSAKQLALRSAPSDSTARTVSFAKRSALRSQSGCRISVQTSASAPSRAGQGKNAFCHLELAYFHIWPLTPRSLDAFLLLYGSRYKGIVPLLGPSPYAL